MVPGERFIDRDLGRHADAPELDEHGNPWPSIP